MVVKLVLHMEYPQEYLDKLASEIIARYQSIIGEDMDIEFVNQIPPTVAGKRRVVISNVPTRSVQDYAKGTIYI